MERHPALEFQDFRQSVTVVERRTSCLWRFRQREIQLRIEVSW